MLVSVMRRFAQPKPTEPPPDNPVWPLWWAPLAFIHTRRSGGLLILGLLAWTLYAALR
jgi:1,4-dihydroxy-2-naphthoate octaprenyltransferase